MARRARARARQRTAGGGVVRARGVAPWARYCTAINPFLAPRRRARAPRSSLSPPTARRRLGRLGPPGSPSLVGEDEYVDKASRCGVGAVADMTTQRGLLVVRRRAPRPIFYNFFFVIYSKRNILLGNQARIGTPVQWNM
jgi:hypothetical protein